MRKIHLVPYCVVLTVGNCILPFFLGVVVKLMHEVYDHTIGKEQELPRLTQFALGLPQWFWVFAVVAIIATVGVFVQKVSASLLVHWLLVLCLVEGAALICFTWGVVDPFIMVFWTLGG